MQVLEQTEMEVNVEPDSIQPQSTWMVVEGIFPHLFLSAVYTFAILRWDAERGGDEGKLGRRWIVAYWLGRVG